MTRSIYEFPDIFRRVHMEQAGEIEAEVAFLKRIWKRHDHRRIRRVLDIACGNSPHGQILAHEGLEVVGVDHSPTMLAAGRRESQGAVRFYRREIERFSIPEPPFDASYFTSETFPVMTANADLLSHLRSVGRLLRRGALYCVDIDRHDGVEPVRGRQVWRERKVRIGHAEVTVREYHRPIAWHSGLHSIYELECRIRFPGLEPVTTRDIIPVRYTLPSTLELAAEASGCFRLVACYADLSFSRPMARCYGRWFGVLRRR